MQDRLVVWLSLAAAFVALVVVVTVGLQPAAVFGLLQVPAVLMLMLTLRAVVCLVRGQPTALRVGSREVLDGWQGLVVPLALLAMWTVGRENGTFSARVSNTSTSDQATATWHTSSQRTDPGAIGGIEVPAAFAQATDIVIEGDAGPLQEQFAAQLRPLARLLAGFPIVGRITMKVETPFAWLPLWKSGDAAAHVDCELYLRAIDSGKSLAVLTGTVEVTGRTTMLGFASHRDFQQYLGTWLGTTTRKQLMPQLQKLADSTR